MPYKMSSGFRNAIAEKKPVIAFESTIITHGLPYPENQELINELEAIASSIGVYLALFWIKDGYIRVGIEQIELTELAESTEVVKVTSRDIPYVLTKGLTGGTTVAATIHLAHQLNIPIFATGGLGGVHFGASESFDISNDLIKLSQTPLIVVSSGVKSVLDVAKTLEMMETLGIPVYGYQTDHFPLFHTRESEYRIKRVETPQEIVSLYRNHLKTGLTSAMIIANPVPVEWSIPKEQLDQVIRQAINDAERSAISGQEVTPYLLKKLSESDLDTVKTNLELVKSNFRLACEIAISNST